MNSLHLWSYARVALTLAFIAAFGIVATALDFAPGLDLHTLGISFNGID